MLCFFWHFIVQTILEEDKFVSNIMPYYSDHNEIDDDDGTTITESMKSGSTTTLRSINEPITERTYDDNFITMRPTTRQSIYTTYYGDYDTVDYHKVSIKHTHFFTFFYMEYGINN